MTTPPVPQRHWRTYGNNYPLPTGAEATDEPFAALPSWFMRVTCERCGHERMSSEVHSAQRAMLIRDIIAKLRHDGCGGRAGKAELLTGSPASRVGQGVGSCYATAEGVARFFASTGSGEGSGRCLLY